MRNEGADESARTAGSPLTTQRHFSRERLCGNQQPFRKPTSPNDTRTPKRATIVLGQATGGIMYVLFAKSSIRNCGENWSREQELGKIRICIALFISLPK